MKLNKLLLMLILTVSVSAAYAYENGNNGGNEGTKIELVKSSQDVPTMQASQEIPDFNLNAEVTEITVLPACSGNTSQSGTTSTPPPSGYTYSGINYYTWGYEVHYEKRCEETITVYYPWGPETYTYESTDTHTVTYTIFD